MLFSLDYLAGARYQDAILHAHPVGFGAGFFQKLDGFGDAIPVANALAASGKCPRIRMHLLWIDGHKYTTAHFPHIIQEARRAEVLAQKHPGVEIRVSGACEHTYTTTQAKQLADLVRHAAPSCTYVNTPMTYEGILHDEINEFHANGKFSHPNMPHFDFSFDGRPVTDSDVEHYKRAYAGAQTFYLWDARFNGQWEFGNTVPRPERKGWADRKFIESLAYLAQDRGAVHLPANWLLKSHSENHGNGDPRAEKPVLICPIRADYAELTTGGGQLVAKLPYYAPFGDRYRYYASSYGYELSDRAKRLSGGSPLCNVMIKSKQFGVVNPAFRFGEFHA